MEPTAERFRALARSAPWRWHALQFTATPPRKGPATAEHTVRAHVQRTSSSEPGEQRVETLTGELLERSYENLDPPPPVRLDADGLAPRVDRNLRMYSEGPMYSSYHWVAMLDPWELDFGIDARDSLSHRQGTEILELAEVEHHGRRAWQALLRPTRFYDPRCGCCPLMYSAESEAAE